MSFPRFKMFAALAMLLALGSCKVDTINNFPSNPASMRYASFMSDVPLVDVKIQGTTSWSNVAFQSLTGYQSFDNVQSSVAVFQPGATTALAESNASLSAKEVYTLVGYGTAANPQLLFQVDNIPNVGSGNTQLRTTDLGYGFGQIAVYITAPGVPLVGLTPDYGLSYGSSTAFQRLTAGMYQVRVTNLSGGQLLYDSGAIELALDASQGIYLYGTGATHSFTALQSAVVGGTTQPLPNQQAALKVVNLAYEVPLVSQQVDGVPKVTGLAYNAATATYLAVVAGQRDITFTATAAPTVTIAEAAITFDGSTDSTVMLSGANGALRISSFADFNTPPTGNTARIRVINAAPDTGAFDVAVDDVVKATNVEYTNASVYIDVSSGNHTVKLYAPGTTTPIYTVDSRAYGGNSVYSIYLSGPASALKQLVTQDNN